MKKGACQALKILYYLVMSLQTEHQLCQFQYSAGQFEEIEKKNYITSRMA